MGAHRRALARRELATALRQVFAARPDGYLTIARPLLAACLQLLDGRQSQTCASCQAVFVARTDGVYCSSRCRQRAARRRWAARNGQAG